MSDVQIIAFRCILKRAKEDETAFARHYRAAAMKAAVRGAWLSAQKPRTELPCHAHLVRIAPRPFKELELKEQFRAIREELALCLGVPNERDSRVRFTYAEERSYRSDVERFAVRIELRRMVLFERHVDLERWSARLAAAKKVSHG